MKTLKKIGIGAAGTIPCGQGRESPMLSQCSHNPTEERQ